MKTPFVSVLVTNYNGLRFLEDIFNSIKKQSYPKSSYDTYLVDNDSKDGSVEFVKRNFKWVKVLQTGGNLGFSGACAYAYDRVKGDFVLPLNNDIILHKDYIKELVETSLREDVAIVDAEEYPPGTDLENAEPRPLTTINITSNYIDVDDNFRNKVQFSGSGGASLVRRDKLPILFDPDYFMYQEDVYMGWNSRLRGGRAVREHRAKFIHIGFGTVGTNPIFKHYLERNRITNCLLFYERRNVYRIAPILLYEAGLKLVKNLVFNRKAFKAFSRAHIWIFRNRDLIKRKRSEIQRYRKVPDKDILSAMSYRIFNSKSGFVRIQNAVVRSYLKLVGIRTGDM